ncbi:hypothetical protein LCGC14_1292530 [marine sediment metagenome]|uniref:Endonuclease GajA/Old nuclease/RecF-like AAA domain-containing protein n=1 Tax=marine sediment metagenome TaxID=412755 RepID=A0A0F9LCU9_9ZZZZ
MKILIENFGPVKSIEIDLNKLMIFVGRNNSGKSYISLLIDIINKSFLELKEQLIELVDLHRYDFISEFQNDDYFLPWMLRVVGSLPIKAFNYESIYKKITKETIDKYISTIEGKMSLKYPFKSRVLIPEEVVKSSYEYFVSFINERFGTIFLRKLTKKFSSKISDLINFDAENSKIAIICKNVEVSLNLRKKDNDVLVSFQFLKTQKSLLKAKQPLKNIEYEIERYFKAKTRLKEKFKNDILNLTSNVIFGVIFKEVMELIMRNFLKTIYIPSTRSGLIQAYETISLAYIQLAPEIPLTKIDFPTLSGISTDFITELYKSRRKPISYREKDKKFLKQMGKIVDFIETNILFGKIEIKKGKEKLGYYITYNIIGHEIPLYRASSMVSELASLVIFLKNLILPRDLLIFEEPESHLHPDSQMQIAMLISMLIKNSVNFIITTHSDFLLGQINNFIKASNLSLKEIKRIYGENLAISKEDVSLNLFVRNDELNETTVKKIELDDFGMTEDIFYKITAELYQKSSIITELLNQKIADE